MLPPSKPRIYHIFHYDVLQSVLRDGYLFSDAIISSRDPSGTAIGMSTIKQRRLNELTLQSHPGLYVGACVPFYYCPRSIMLYILHKGNDPGPTYAGGQAPIIHLEFDLRSVSDWATKAGKRWAITRGNASSRYFDDYSSLANLSLLNWQAVQARQWYQSDIKEAKQSEFLVEDQVPWSLVRRIGVHNEAVRANVEQFLTITGQQPPIEIKLDWYY
jgi:hypothetical protein